MPWNWELPEWPHFHYEPAPIVEQERAFLLNLGGTAALLEHTRESDYNNYVVDVLSREGVDSSKIEGELLDRDSLQSSIKRHLGLHAPTKPLSDKEVGMAEVLCSLFETTDQPLSHDMLHKWHATRVAKQP